MQNRLYSPTYLHEMQKRHGFHISKSLGQNFLLDKNIVDKIIDGSEIQPEDLVIEVGPGMGVLTRQAASLAKKIISIEIDGRLIPILNETLSDLKNVQIIHGDILKTDLHEIIASETNSSYRAVKVLGNLPYYITTPIIMKILEDRIPVERLTIMMQKEVADRIKANPSTKDYGALSVAVQYYCEVRHVTNVPKDVFFPKPKVDSAVISLLIRNTKPVSLKDEELFFRVIKAGFGQRRKTLLNSLQSISELSKQNAADALDAAGIDAMRRGESLSIQEFANLSNAIAVIQPKT